MEEVETNPEDLSTLNESRLRALLEQQQQQLAAAAGAASGNGVLLSGDAIIQQPQAINPNSLFIDAQGNIIGNNDVLLQLDQQRKEQQHLQQYIGTNASLLGMQPSAAVYSAPASMGLNQQLLLQESPQLLQQPTQIPLELLTGGMGAAGTVPVSVAPVASFAPVAGNMILSPTFINGTTGIIPSLTLNNETLSSALEANAASQTGASPSSAAEKEEDEEESNSRAGSHSGPRKKDRQKPKRPLSAYNFYFKHERARILKCIDQQKRRERGEVVDSDQEEDDKSDDSSAENKNGNSRFPSNKTKKKKPHGKISFENLAKTIGVRWAKLDDEEMAYYKNLAAEDMKRYKNEMKECLDMEAKEKKRMYDAQQKKLAAKEKEESMRKSTQVLMNLNPMQPTMLDTQQNIVLLPQTIPLNMQFMQNIQQPPFALQTALTPQAQVQLLQLQQSQPQVTHVSGESDVHVSKRQKLNDAEE